MVFPGTRRSLHRSECGAGDSGSWPECICHCSLYRERWARSLSVSRWVWPRGGTESCKDSLIIWRFRLIFSLLLSPSPKSKARQVCLPFFFPPCKLAIGSKEDRASHSDVVITCAVLRTRLPASVPVMEKAAGQFNRISFFKLQGLARPLSWGQISWTNLHFEWFREREKKKNPKESYFMADIQMLEAMHTVVLWHIFAQIHLCISHQWLPQ